MMQRHLQGVGMTSQRTRDRMIQRLSEQGIIDKRILNIMRTTPRHIFIDEALASRAYEDTALPIGYYQTISQPYIVARMTELLFETKQTLSNVLEIGTGCGYQTAILAQLAESVYSVERLLPLQKKAKSHTELLKLKNIRYLHSDGGWGWEDHAPYEGILVAAAPSEIPQALLEQLMVGGVMVIPVANLEDGTQSLKRITRTESSFQIEEVEPVSFVPFLSGKE
ncbi:MAG: Protein-L-isoaspartate O-methyltransferase [Pseudomonadota bacterium]|jgi:protein-L-isoaspartate(D-aspartate) O-methyltransferase